MKNFRNVCRTLASRHQLRQCYELESLSLDEEVSTSSAIEVKAKAVHERAKPHLPSAVYSVKSACMNRCFYRVGDILVLEEQEMPVFGQVETIYVSLGKLNMVVKHT